MFTPSLFTGIKMVIRFLPCFAFFAVSITCYGQKNERIAIPLHQNDSCIGQFCGGFQSTVRKKSTEGYIVPDFLKQPRIDVYYPNLIQRDFSRLRSGKMKAADFADMYSFKDTNNLYKGTISQELSVLSGTNGSGKPLLMIDVNRNKDFTDDAAFDLYTSSQKIWGQVSIYPMQSIVNDFYDGTQLKKRAMYVKPMIIFSDSIHLLKPELMAASITDVALGISGINLGEVEIQGEKFNFLVQENLNEWRSNKAGVFYWKKNEEIPGLSNDQYIAYRVGDTIGTGKNTYLLDAVAPNFDTLYLQRIKTIKPLYGFNKGEYIKPFFGKDLNTGRLIAPVKKSKYLLIDYWGTWCVPCIEAIPALSDLYNLYKKKGLDLVSIAVEYKESETAVIKAARQHNIYWKLMYEKRRDFLSMHHRLRVLAFPTFILIDAKGKILHRGSGADELKIIRTIIDKGISVR
jgi:thiol-disulfide isomerase/thioredoxin